MGGNAFENTDRIEKAHIPATLAGLAKNLTRTGLNYNYLYSNMLGSAGKNATSGDIDLNIDETKFDFDLIGKKLIEAYGPENVKLRPGNKQIFTSIPSAGGGRRDKGRVQVDFMFGDYEWQKFSFWSPKKVVNTWDAGTRSDTSRYKGLYRTEFIKAIVAFNSDWVLEENDEMVARAGPTFFHDRGVVWRYRYRPFKRGSTTERIKALKEVTREEFLELFPSAVLREHEDTKDPNFLVWWLFFQTYYSKEEFLKNDYQCQQAIMNMRTYEGLRDMVRSYYGQAAYKYVHKIFLERLNSLKADIPPEILRAAK